MSLEALAERLESIEKNIIHRLSVLENRVGKLEAPITAVEKKGASVGRRAGRQASRGGRPAGGRPMPRSRSRAKSEVPRAPRARSRSRTGAGAVNRQPSYGGSRSKADILEQLNRRKSDGQKQSEIEEEDARNARMDSYRFGSRKLYYMQPEKMEEYRANSAADVSGALTLEYAYGYNGKDINSKQNLFITPDTGELVYYLAAVGVVNNFDATPDTQKFFFGHNEDITCITLAPAAVGRPWVATSQTDPKDVPGRGKDMPKIKIWDYTTMECIETIENASWGLVKKLQWSGTYKKNLYSLGGDESQSLSCWSTAKLGNRSDPKRFIARCPLQKEDIYGIKVCPQKTKKESTDEFVIVGKRKFSYVYFNIRETAKGPVGSVDIKQIAISAAGKLPKGIKATDERAFFAAEFLSDGSYVVGGFSGAIYLCRGPQVLAVNGAHAVPGKMSAVGDLVLTEEGRFASGGFDGRIMEWSVSSGSGKPQLKLESASAAVSVPGSDFDMGPRAMAYRNREVYVGSRSNQVISYNLDSGNTQLLVDGHDGQVWGLACSPPTQYSDGTSGGLVVTGGYDNAIKIWDYKKKANVETYEFDKAVVTGGSQQVSSVSWSEDGKYIAVGTEQSNIFLFSYDGGLKLLDWVNIPPKTKRAMVEAVSNVNFNDEHDLLAVAHYDSRCYIFSIDGGKLQRWRPITEAAAPSHATFGNGDGVEYVKILTRDYEVTIHELNRETKRAKRIARHPDPDTTHWDGDPLIAGWDVQGLYQPEWDGTDLNDASVNKEKTLIASGDDYGWVRLHNYPALAPDKNFKYQAHSAFVVGIEWTGAGDYLMTCGGADFAIFQWKVNK